MGLEAKRAFDRTFSKLRIGIRAPFRPPVSSVLCLTSPREVEEPHLAQKFKNHDLPRTKRMKQPEPSDFDVQVLRGVNVNFKPTFSYYWFDRLARKPRDMVQKLGPISSSATVRHMGWTRDTGAYNADEVATMAYRLASEAAAEAYK